LQLIIDAYQAVNEDFDFSTGTALSILII